jgi:light-regulated signal transduction histidine kinase (bacteriophytochrome)
VTTIGALVAEPALDPGDHAQAMLNVLDDNAAEDRVLKDTQMALLNILEDSAHEQKLLRNTQAAVLNILEDAASGRLSANAAFTASLNILGDLNQEKEHSAEQAAQLTTANSELQASNRELELFAYVASHDLSEPLRAISGPISLLARRYQGQLDADADAYITFAVDGCQRMQTIINDLLLYSRVGRLEGPRRAIDVAGLLATVQAALRQSIADSGAQIVVGPMPTVCADRTQLDLVFQNLLANALKFTRPGVVPHIEVTAERTGDTFEFSVTDNGIGVEPAYRDRVFGMFKRLHTREQYPGTGIGLALVKKIVERHGGTTGLTDSPSGGSRFWFALDAGTDDTP